MQIAPTADLAPFVGTPVDVTYRLNGRTHVAHVVVAELHHGATASPGYGLEGGVHGCANYLTLNGQRRVESSWFYWPYNGLTITAAGV